MTTVEVANLLGCTRRTVLRLAEKGSLPYEVKLPGSTGLYLFSRAVVDLYLRQHEAS